MALKILSVVETRSGLIKAMALCDAIQRFNRVSPHSSIDHVLVHTGEFSNTRGFDLYFNDLDLPQPQLFLGVAASANPFEKTAKITTRLADVLMRERPAVVIVIGDVDSVLDCALVTKRVSLQCQGEEQSLAPALARLGAGQRSPNRSASQEVNRTVVDSLSDYLFISEENANRNLLREGVSPDKIHFVGSVVIDTLLRHRERVADSSILNDLQLSDGSSVRPFALLSLQHLSDAGGKGKLSQLQTAFSKIAQRMPVVFPASAAALKLIHEADMGDYFIDHFRDGPEPWDARVRIRLIPPLGYFDFVRLMSAAKVVLTDSRSVGEETGVLGVPCITLSEHTFKPVTPGGGVNALAETNPERILDAFVKAIRGTFSPPALPRGWDGRAAERIVDTLWNDFASGEPCKRPLEAKSKPVSCTSM
ncbi:MAG TPA: UDP-N-acetylglucosamine 2-epimerase [Candidatus Binatia bacterium]|jgi:UDP-N-acetylglucosamine 2-epimerase (non-hydrolysing)